MKLFIRICSILVAAALVLTIFAVVIYSGVSAQSVSLSAAAVTVEPGDQASVDITLEQSGVYGAQFTLGYDSALLSVSGVAVSSAVTAAGLKSAVNPAYGENTVSVIIYGACEIPAGVIATVTFDTSVSGNCDITVDNLVLSGADNSALSGTAAGGSVTVQDVTPPAAELAVYAKNLKLGSDVTLNVYVDPAYIETYGYTDLYVRFSLSDRVRNVNADSNRVNGYLQFSFKNINPYELGQNIYITVYGTYNGRQYNSETQTYSVVNYCANTFAKSSVSNATKTMMADMLNYGAAVQQYIGKYTDALCNANPAVAAYVEQYETKTDPTLSSISNKAYKTADSATADWLGGSLVLGSAVSVNFAFNTDEDKNDLEVRIYDGDTLKQTFAAAEIAQDETGGFYYVRFSKYGPAFMSRAIDVEIYKNGEKISNTFRYSIESYAYSKVNGNSSAQLKNVCITMMKYGNAAALL